MTRGGSEVLDLTMRLDDDTPVYPGDPAVRVLFAATFEDAGYFNTRLALGSHNGTHLDAEGHMIPGGRMLDGYPVGRFHGRGVLLDVRDVRDGVVAAPGIEAAPGMAFDAAFGTPAHAAIDEGCIVLLWTGISDARGASDYYARVPQLPDGLVDLLIARGVGMVGVDAGSIDDAPFAVHKALLGSGILIAENLVGLSAVAARLRPDGVDAAGARPFTVWALPLNVAAEASPARVVAVFA